MLCTLRGWGYMGSGGGVWELGVDVCVGVVEVGVVVAVVVVVVFVIGRRGDRPPCMLPLRSSRSRRARLYLHLFSCHSGQHSPRVAPELVRLCQWMHGV